MPEAGGEVLATRVAFLELQDERRLVQEGYELLDEKRMLLATEIMRQLRRHRELKVRLDELAQQARAALTGAVDAGGFDDLTVQRPQSLDGHVLREDTSQFLGIRLLDAGLEPAVPAAEPPPLQLLPEVRACAGAFHQLLAGHASAAACAGNLRRLAREYARTERRARALENVVLPEIDVSLRYIEEQLDALDQEEAVRVRNAGKSATMAGG
ncbi:MAG: V-type ATP synthase subunit D [Steroidobacteraceae bacterium]|nr:V-type ATP synthase subunit D [Steroidobacteraceae bacterium]